MILNMGGGGVVPKLNYDETIITPGTEDQIVPSGTYHRGDMTILGDSDLIANNIRKGTEIFGVTGTLEHIGDSDLIPENIKSGVNIFGVVGTMIKGLDLSVLGYSKMAIDKFTFSGYTKVSGKALSHSLGVKPKEAFVICMNPSAVSSSTLLYQWIRHVQAHNRFATSYSTLYGYGDGYHTGSYYEYKDATISVTTTSVTLSLGSSTGPHFLNGCEYALVTLA